MDFLFFSYHLFLSTIAVSLQNAGHLIALALVREESPDTIVRHSG